MDVPLGAVQQLSLTIAWTVQGPQDLQGHVLCSRGLPWGPQVWGMGTELLTCVSE